MLPHGKLKKRQQLRYRSRHFFKKKNNLGKIDLPRSIHTNFKTEIRILSAIRALFTKGWIKNPSL